MSRFTYFWWITNLQSAEMKLVSQCEPNYEIHDHQEHPAMHAA